MVKSLLELITEKINQKRRENNEPDLTNDEVLIIAIRSLADELGIEV